MSADPAPEKETLRRVQDGLFHLRRGLAPFVAKRMTVAYGADWLRHASRAAGTRPDDALDAYGLLKTMIDSWREVFEEAFSREDRYRIRSFVALALDGRNAVAHVGQKLEDDAALRYLDACHQLLRVVKAPEAETAELKRLYDAERYAGTSVGKPASGGSSMPAPSDAKALAVGTIEERLLAYVRKNPDLDDDELARNLGIQPRQSINLAARRLAERGLLRRFRGPSGKIVNRAEGAR